MDRTYEVEHAQDQWFTNVKTEQTLYSEVNIPQDLRVSPFPHVTSDQYTQDQESNDIPLNTGNYPSQ